MTTERECGRDHSEKFRSISCAELIGSGIHGAVFTHITQHYVNVAGPGSFTPGFMYRVGVVMSSFLRFGRTLYMGVPFTVKENSHL